MPNTSGNKNRTEESRHDLTGDLPRNMGSYPTSGKVTSAVRTAREKRGYPVDAFMERLESD